MPGVTPAAKRLRRPAAADTAPPSATGCAFAARCPWAEARCRDQRPPLRALGTAGDALHTAACHRAEAVIATPDAAIETADALTQNA